MVTYFVQKSPLMIEFFDTMIIAWTDRVVIMTHQNTSLKSVASHLNAALQVQNIAHIIALAKG